MKRKYKIIGIIVIGTLVIVGIIIGWSQFTSEPPEVPGDGGEPTLPGDSGQDSQQQADQKQEKFSLVELSDDDVSVFDLWEGPTSGEVYYITIDGVVRSAKPGPDPEISTRSFSAINKVRPSDSGLVLVAFGDPKNPEWRLFDSGDGVWRPMPGFIKDAIWSEDEGVVFAVANTDTGTSLISLDVADLRGENDQEYSVLERNFGFKDVEIQLGIDNSVVVTEKPASFYGSGAWRLNTETSEITTLLSSVKGLWLDWVRGDNLIFSYSSGDGFAVLDSEMESVLPILFTTFPSKCTASEVSVYCFVPESLSERGKMVLPDDYLKNKFYTTDSLYRVDRGFGGSNKIIDGESDFHIAVDANKLKHIDNDLYFINKYDQVLYKIELEGE